MDRTKACVLGPCHECRWLEDGTYIETRYDEKGNYERRTIKPDGTVITETPKDPHDPTNPPWC